MIMLTRPLLHFAMAQNVQHHPTRHASFWGECTATLDWCEENYHHTPFIAEFCTDFECLLPSNPLCREYYQ